MSKSISILLIDDEEELVELYEMKLSSKAHSVTTAFTGNQGIAQLKSKNFDLILCDINMPDGNGFDVYNFHRASGAKTTFAFITGHAKGSKELMEAEKTGAIVFNKPVQFDDIWSLIAKVNSNPISAIKASAPSSSASVTASPSPSPSATASSKASPPPPREDVKISDSLEKKGMDLIRSINSKKK